MAVGSISATATSTGQNHVAAAPKEITKSELETMSSRMAESGQGAPKGLDTLIEKFDDAAGSSGKMTFAQFKSFAADNGVTLPDQPNGGARSGDASSGTQSVVKMPTDSKQSGKTSSSESSSSSTSSTTDVANATDQELRKLVAKGNQEAQKELDRRDERRTADGIGTKVDAWA
jgi:hypothetical protein